MGGSLYRADSVFTIINYQLQSCVIKQMSVTFERGLSTTPHCLKWYKLVLRTRLATPTVRYLVLTHLLNCVAAGCNVNAVAFEQKTALHYAAARGLDPTSLLEAGANPRARDAADNTPLHAAAAGGHGSVVRTLVPCSDPLAVNSQGRTALHLSAGQGDVACLEAILDAAGPQCCVMLDASRHLPVYYAAYNGHYDATVFFIGVNAQLYTGKLICLSSWLKAKFH